MLGIARASHAERGREEEEDLLLLPHVPQSLHSAPHGGTAQVGSSVREQDDALFCKVYDAINAEAGTGKPEPEPSESAASTASHAKRGSSVDVPLSLSIPEMSALVQPLLDS